MPEHELPDFTLLPAATAVDWAWAPFMERARRVHAEQDLPDWKLLETCRSLHRIYALAESEGQNPKEALMRLDVEMERLFGVKVRQDSATE